jgi:excisionase family DNA binding protein
MQGDYISVKEASERYGLSEGRIRQLLRANRLAGRKFGNAWAVSVASLEAYTPFPQKAPKKR